MDNPRRLFFRQMALSAADVFHSLVPQPPPGAATRMKSDILGDLTPELLTMEAERLGLDPEKDRQMVLESIQAAMGCPKDEDLPM